MLSQKIDLENKIFAHGAQLNVPIYGVQGALRAYTTAPYLCALIDVYNAFFAEENKAIYVENENKALEMLFCAQRTCLPILKKPFGIAFFKQDFANEFFYLTGRLYE